MPENNIGIKFTTIGGQAALAQSANIAKAMEGINIAQMKLVRSQTTAAGITRTYETSQGRLVTSTQKAGQAQQKYTKIVDDTTKAKKGLFGQTQSVLSAIGKVATWTIATTAVFGLFRAITGLITTLMDFENAMARVSTATRGGEEALLQVRNAVKEYGRTTSASLMEVAKAMYLLGSAGLTASEQVAGLEHVMDLTVGTMGQVDQVARLVSGAYNVFGQNLEGAITASEKMQQISDIMAYTFSCYTPDTEVLTDKGWKLFTELDKTEKIASLNPKTKELEYQKPHTYVNQPFEGKLCHLKGSFADIKITPTHKLYTKLGNRPVNQNYVLVEAKDVFGRAKAFYRGCKWKGKTPKYFVLPAVNNPTGDGKEKKIPIKIWMRFLAWYLSEGHCVWTNKDGKPIYCVTISQSEKSSYYNDLFEVINLMPFNATQYKDSKRVGGFHIVNKQLCAYLKQFKKAKEKHIPDFIKGLSKNLLRLFIETYAYGDGTHVKESWAIHIFTASNRMKDDFQEIALKADYGCTAGWRKGSEKVIKSIKTKSSGSWDITLSKRTEFLMNDKRNKYEAIKKNRSTNTKEEWIDYKGNVVCVEVPNHVIFIRRNGKSFWCGNTQQIELSEIASAMGLVGSVAGLIEMPLNVLVGTLGELNTSLLKGTRAGTSIMNALLQISKKSDMLTDKLGMVFDPTKPLDFVDIMEKLNRKYGEGALSVMELKELMDVFGLRGGRAVGVILNRYERWLKTVNKGKDDFEGFAELMREQFEDTLPRQLGILGNNIRVAFVEGFEESGNALTRFLKKVNESIEKGRKEREKIQRTFEIGFGLRGEEVPSELKRIKEEQDLLGERVGAEKSAYVLFSEMQDEKIVRLAQEKDIYDLIIRDESDIIRKSKEVNEEKKEFLELLKKGAEKEGSVYQQIAAIRPELEKMLGTETVLSMIREKMLQNAINNLNSKKEEVAITKDLLYSTERGLVAEEKRHQIQMMRMDGYTDEQIAHRNIVDFVEKINAAKRKDLGTTENIVTLNQLLAATDKERLVLMAQLGGNLENNVLEFSKLVNQEFEASKKLTAEIAANLQTAVESGIEGLLTGTKDWKTALQDIGKVMLKAQIGEVGKALQQTGIFKTVASGITQAHKTGGDYVKQSIISGYSEAAGAAGAVSRAGAAVPSAGGGGGIGGLFGGLFGGRADKYGIQRGGPTNAPGQIGRRPGAPTGGGGYGTVMTAASTAISGYMAGSAAGGGGLGAGIGGIIGAGIGSFGGPVGTMIGGMIGGMLGGLFDQGGKKGVQIERKEEDRTTRVASKLDVTNKQLEWVNRNLVALRVEMEPYPMPESAYFAERWGGRGGGATFGNIIIHVGTDAQGRDVADAFAERFIVHGNRILQ